jgi:hypothetical protein
MDWLIEVGCGWLGWTPEAVRGAHLQDIHLAYKGKIKMLQACYGSPEENEKTKPVRERPATLENFDKMFI